MNSKKMNGKYVNGHVWENIVERLNDETNI